MKRLIVSTVCFVSVCGAEQVPHTELDLESAISRLVSYGIIQEDSEDELDDTVEILQHYEKFTNGDEEINEFPYCLRLIEAGGEENQLPVSCLRPFVAAGATVQGDGGDTSPLQAAAEVGNVKVLSYLLDEGADIHYTDAALKTAMDYALMGELTPEHCEVVRELLRRHALPTPSAMCYAARYHTALLQDMVEHVSTPSPEVVNAAVWNADSLEFLLQNGANPCACEDNGTSLSHALLQRISTGKWQVEELVRLVDLLILHKVPFYVASPRDELELMLPEEMPAEIREHLLTLYTTRPQPTFPETEESDVEEIIED